jgi:hypothetical protein
MTERESILAGHQGLPALAKLVMKEAVIDYFAPVTALWRFLRKQVVKLSTRLRQAKQNRPVPPQRHSLS